MEAKLEMTDQIRSLKETKGTKLASGGLIRGLETNSS